ncbi:transposase [Phytohabitans kaempferiae]|uniref:Transposase n=1 Tax=Phytohabitans kaempferiae TaxID=1620943 RepID=A0ABV6M0Y8_9ACTN
MALVRVYCGLASADPTAREASAESRLTVAVVDDAGRLLDVCEISDDPAGYAQLGSLLVERSSGPTGVAIAADSDDHLVTSLLTAAGRPLAIADDDAVDDYAERFADDESVEEMQSPADERRAVGLARALQAGALSAVALPVPRDLLAYKPVLAAHAALCNGRLSAAVALREVLRELYPAALRAYPDPAEPVSLAVLDALPEPSLLNGTASGRGRETTSATDAVISQLAAEGVADAETVAEKVTALRVAIAETPRRGSANKALVPAVSEAVRQAVAAVRACDLGCEALVSTLNARLTVPPAAGRRTTVRRPGAGAAPSAPALTGLHSVRPPAEEPAPTRVGRRARPEPAAASAAPTLPQAVTTPPVAPAPVSRPPVAPPPINRPAAARGGDTGRRHAEPAGRPAPHGQPAAPPALPSAPPLAPAASAEPPVRPSVAPPPAGRPMTPPVAPAAISAPTPLPIRSSAPPARPAMPAAHSGEGSDTAQIALPLSRPEPPRPPEPARTPEPARGLELPRAPEPAPNRPISAPPPPPPGITPIAPAAVVPSQRGLAPADSGEPFRATLTTAAINSARAERQRPTPIPPRPNTRHDAPPAHQGGAPTQSGFGATDLSVPLPRHAPEPGSRANWPLVNSSESDRSRVDAEPSRPRLDAEPAPPRVEADPAARGGSHQRANGDRSYSAYSELDRPAQQAAQDGRVTPPWQADDLPQEPPMLRLVEPPPLADRALDDRPLTGLTALDAPSLRLVDTEAIDRGARTARSRRAVERSAVPVAEEGDGDLLIFAQTRSAWFVGHPEEDQLDWASSADTGWRAAEQAAKPSVGAETSSGLPRRVPQANLVPGSALPPREERPLRIVRDAQSIAAHTTGYFRGWRRGQEIGGYAVGGRPGRESAGGWDFSRDSVGREDEYRSAGYRS